MRKSSVDINEFLAIMFEKNVSYFNKAAKYQYKVHEKNINKNFKNLLEKDNDVGLKFLPLGLPWMTISTIISKILLFIYNKKLQVKYMLHENLHNWKMNKHS